MKRTLTLIALAICSFSLLAVASPALAATNGTVRCAVIKRTHEFVVVKHSAKKIKVVKGESVVKIDGEQYKVVKMTRSFVWLENSKRKPWRPLPTATPTPVITPTPTPTAVPTATPTPVITPTPTPTAVPTAVPTATPTAAPAPSETPVAAEGFNVMNYGAKADGISDDSAAILAAAKAANGKPVQLPAGTYAITRTLELPANVHLVGAGMNATWIKGRIDFGSNGSFTDLKIGDAGKCAINSYTATGTSFTRVQFRGGAGDKNVDWNDCHVITLQRSTSNITFTDCNVEANLGVEDAQHTKHFNNVYINPRVVAPSMENIIFRGCNFGVSNGVRSGSPRFNVEIYADNGAATKTQGFRNISFDTCVFDNADDENLDYSGSYRSDDPTQPNDGFSYVRNCTFKGNGKGNMWYCDLVVEAGAGNIEISGNTFYRGVGQAIAVGGNGAENVNTNCKIFNNTIDARSTTFDTGLTHEAFEYIQIYSNYNTLTGNTVYNTSQYRRAVTMRGDYNTLTGNTLVNAPAGGYVIGFESTANNNTFPLDSNTMIGGGMSDKGVANVTK